MKSKTKTGWGGPRPGSGRKPISEAERRSKRLMVNLSEDEHDELRRAAGDEPLGGFVRRLILRYLARRRK